MPVKKKNGNVSNWEIPIPNETSPKIENKGEIMQAKISKIAMGIENNTTNHE